MADNILMVLEMNTCDKRNSADACPQTEKCPSTTGAAIMVTWQCFTSSASVPRQQIHANLPIGESDNTCKSVKSCEGAFTPS